MHFVTNITPPTLRGAVYTAANGKLVAEIDAQDQKIHYTSAHSLWSAAHDWRHRGLALPDRGHACFRSRPQVMPFCPSPHQGIVEGTII